MNDKPLTFQQLEHVPLIGQPFAVVAWSLPANVTVVCHCTPDRPPLQIIMSQPIDCPDCGKVYSGFFNPQTQKLEMRVLVPKATQVKS